MHVRLANTPYASQISIVASRVRTRACRNRIDPPSSRTTRVPVMSRPADCPRERTSIVKGSSSIQNNRVSENRTITIASEEGDRLTLFQLSRLMTSPPAYRE